MNTPNKLTVARMIMVPFLVVFLLTGWGGEANRYISLILFVAASITDWFDGYLARKNHLVTNFGKFMDPLADKLLVCSAMICMIELGRLPAWFVIIFIIHCSNHHYCKRIYYQWISSDRCRERDCYCGELLGQVQDRITDDHDHSVDPAL